MKQKIRIGCGAGFAGDRIEPAIKLAAEGNLNYLVLECLAERTIALAQQRKRVDPTKGYDLLLDRRIESLLPLLVENKVRLITNMGAANPLAAAQRVIEIATAQNIKVRVAAVTGDDVFDHVRDSASSIRDTESNKLLSDYELISANAYLGAEPILNALKTDASIILTGRVADPSLFIAPMCYEFGWSGDQFDLLGKGTVTGHLLECAGQVSGGYFADGVHKKVDGLAELGHPFADVFPDGSSVISKVDGTGGLINLQTVKEQLLYEVMNPREYFTPDVIADFSEVQLQEAGDNRVRISGGSGKQRPDKYKVSVGYKAFYLGEGEISYAGSAAFERAVLASEILQKRLERKVEDLRIDLIGMNALHRTSFNHTGQPYEIRVRAAGKATSRKVAEIVGQEVEALYTNGPAGGGGARKFVTEVVGIVSTMIDRHEINPQVTTFEV